LIGSKSDVRVTHVIENLHFKDLALNLMNEDFD
jgi:hypothetical protein